MLLQSKYSHLFVHTLLMQWIRRLLVTNELFEFETKLVQIQDIEKAFYPFRGFYIMMFIYIYKQREVERC